MVFGIASVVPTGSSPSRVSSYDLPRTRTHHRRLPRRIAGMLSRAVLQPRAAVSKRCLTTVTQLPNGVRVATQKTHDKHVTVGVWGEAGNTTVKLLMSGPIPLVSQTIPYHSTRTRDTAPGMHTISRTFRMILCAVHYEQGYSKCLCLCLEVPSRLSWARRLSWERRLSWTRSPRPRWTFRALFTPKSLLNPNLPLREMNLKATFNLHL